jgi:hypothetical protein
MNYRVVGSIGAVLLSTGAALGQVVDGSFEAGAPNPSWDEMSTNFGTPLCNGECIGPGSPSEARTGQWWAWFGGIDSMVETGMLSQVVNIPAGSPVLNFYLVGFSARTDGMDFLKVFIDNTEVFSVTDQTLGPYTTDYTLVTVPLAAFAGGMHTLKFSSTTNGGGFLTNFWVDDVSIEGGGGPACYANCDASTTQPILNVLDFICFQSQFAQATSYANCDNSTTPPILNVLDFICFQGRFAQGCP